MKKNESIQLPTNFKKYIIFRFRMPSTDINASHDYNCLFLYMCKRTIQIAAFNPPEKKFIEENDYTEEDLLYFINNVRVIDAQSVFNSIHTKG